MLILLTKEIEVKLHGKNIKHFKDKGYNIKYILNKNGKLIIDNNDNYILVKVDDLMPSSTVNLEIQCDYCGKKYNRRYEKYNKLKKDNIYKDCCSDCFSLKLKEIGMMGKDEIKVIKTEILTKYRNNKEELDKIYKKIFFYNEDVSEKSGIYVIRNLINKKIYIGSAKNFRIRRNRHFNELRNGTHYNNYLQNAFNKYGEENFIFEIIEVIEDIEKLLEFEQYWIDLFTVYDDKYGYNISHKAGRPGEIIWTEEMRENLRIKNIGKTLTEEHKQKIGNSNKGRKRDADFGKKLSKILKGKKLSKEVIDKMKGKRLGEENGNSKLVKEDVIEIKKMIKQGIKLIRIAELFNVTSTLICNIKYNRTWTHVNI